MTQIWSKVHSGVRYKGVWTDFHKVYANPKHTGHCYCQTFTSEHTTNPNDSIYMEWNVYYEP
jgi:hypothetical protein